MVWKLKVGKFNFNFLNSHFSFNNASIIITFLQEYLKTLSEESVSQNFDLGSK